MNAVSRQTAAALMEVENLAVSFGAVEAVRGISFSVGEGEILGLVGESGSGKSITCRALLGLLPGMPAPPAASPLAAATFLPCRARRCAPCAAVKSP